MQEIERNAICSDRKHGWNYKYGNREEAGDGDGEDGIVRIRMPSSQSERCE